MIPRIFISYTTHGDTEPDRRRNQERAAGLAELLEERGRVRPLWDRGRLAHEIGNPWRPVLHEMLARAHGAVLLLSPEAMGSQWVAQEAAIAEHRRHRTDWFVLVPALVGGAQPADLAGSQLGAVDIQRLQLFSSEGPALLVEIAEQVERPFEDWRPRVPEADVRDLVFDILRRHHHLALRGCADELEMDMDSIFADEQLSHLLARGIAERMFARLEEGEIRPVLKGLQRLRPALDRSRALEVFDAVVPFSVDRGMAAQLREAVIGGPGRPAVGLNARRAATGELFARRASIPQEWTVTVPLDRYGEDEGEASGVVAEVEEVLCQKLRIHRARRSGPRRPHERRELLALKIRALVEALGQPQLVVLPGEAEDEDLETLGSRYGQLRCLVLTRRARPENADWRWTRLSFLEPGLADGAEDEIPALAHHESAREVLAGYDDDREEGGRG